jgi:glycosyltransferase involved in cell wall biosynthesis
MYREKEIAVVVPAYNEELLIGRVVETMPDLVDHIVIVNDCSTDGTIHQIEEMISAGQSRIHLIRHEVNQGVGGAIMTGYQYCRDQEVAITVVMAGDAQMDPDDLPALLDPVIEGRADYSKGNRLFTGEAWSKIPKVRYLGNSMLSLMTKIASGYWNVADSQTGYTAASLKVLQTLPLDKVFKRYGMPNDFLVRHNIYDFKVVDVPVEPVYGIGEKSGIKYFPAIPRLSWLLITLFFHRMKEKYIIRDFHPLIFFYFMGFLCFPSGMIYGLYLVGLRIFQGPILSTAPMFAAFMVITGMQSFFFGMWMDMQHNK